MGPVDDLDHISASSSAISAVPGHGRLPSAVADIRHQLEMLELVVRIHARRGLTVVMVLHDLAQAALFGVHARLVADDRPVDPVG